MYNNYKLKIYADSWCRCYTDFKTDYMDGYFETLRVIVESPNADHYQIEEGEIHIKEQTIKSKLLQEMYAQIQSQQ